MGAFFVAAAFWNTRSVPIRAPALTSQLRQGESLAPAGTSGGRAAEVGLDFAMSQSHHQGGGAALGVSRKDANGLVWAPGCPQSENQPRWRRLGHEESRTDLWVAALGYKYSRIDFLVTALARQQSGTGSLVTTLGCQENRTDPFAMTLEREENSSGSLVPGKKCGRCKDFFELRPADLVVTC